MRTLASEVSLLRAALQRLVNAICEATVNDVTPANHVAIDSHDFRDWQRDRMADGFTTILLERAKDETQNGAGRVFRRLTVGIVSPDALRDAESALRLSEPSTLAQPRHRTRPQQ